VLVGTAGGYRARFVGEDDGLDAVAQARVAVYHNGMNVSDDEEGMPIYVATGLRGSWAFAWPAFRVSRREGAKCVFGLALAGPNAHMAGGCGTKGGQPQLWSA
jgi:hypothetical protein